MNPCACLAVENCGVIEKASGAMVGDVVLQPAPFAPGKVEPEYHFARRGQHRGFGTEVARALVEHAFAVSSLRRLVAAIALGNVSSLKLAERGGSACERSAR